MAAVNPAAIESTETNTTTTPAGLDSFATEPLAGEHAFRGVANVVLTPHIGGVTSDAYVSMGTAAARNVLAALEDAEAQPH